MAEALNWILSDSQRAAEVYSGLVEASDLDSQMWDFVEMRKDHEQIIVGKVKRTLERIGVAPRQKSRKAWPELSRHRALRVYEDKQTLQALREGERATLEDCEQLISMGEVDRGVQSFVANSVMPIVAAHIETLDRYLQRAQASAGH